jgi:hypothetical protein
VSPLHPVGVVARYVVLGAAVGVPVGLLWAWWAPRVVVRSVADADFVEAYPQGFAITDLTLGALLLVAGVVVGAVAARRLVRTGFVGGWVHVLGAVAGAAVCAAVGRVLGWWVAGRQVASLSDGTYALPITVGADGVLLLAVFSALLVIVLVAAFAREPVSPGSVPSAHS